METGANAGGKERCSWWGLEKIHSTGGVGMKKKYKLVYMESGKEVVLVSTDPSALMIVLNQKVSAHVSKYRDSAAFELVSYGETKEK